MDFPLEMNLETEAMDLEDINAFNTDDALK